MDTSVLLWSCGGIMVGTVAGFAAGELLPSDGNRRNIGKKIMSALIGAILGHVAVQSAYSQYVSARVQNMLESKTARDSAEQWIHRQDEPVRSLFGRVLMNLDTQLSLMSNGEMLVPRDNVFNIWHHGFELMQHGDRVYATNVVSKEDWAFFGPDGGGRRIQELAIDRGVAIRRVMLIDTNNPDHRAGLHELALLHQSVGVEVRELSKDWLETPSFQGWLQQLGTSDIVLFGDSFLLLTSVDPESNNIQRSHVSTDPNKLTAARLFYNRLWQDARPIEVAPGG